MNSDEIDLYKLNTEFCKLGLNYKRNLALPSIEYINCSKKTKSTDKIWESPNHYVYSNLSKGVYKDIISTYKKTYSTKYSKKINISSVLSNFRDLYKSDPVWTTEYETLVLNNLIKKFPEIAVDYHDIFEKYETASLLNELKADEKYKDEIINFNKNLYIVNYFRSNPESKGNEFFEPGVLIVDDFLNPPYIKVSKTFGKYRIFKLKEAADQNKQISEDEIYKEWDFLKKKVNIEDDKINDEYLREKEKEKIDIYEPYLIFYNEEIINNGQTWISQEVSPLEISKIIKSKWKTMDPARKKEYRKKYNELVMSDYEKNKYIDTVTLVVHDLKSKGDYTKTDYDRIFSLKNPFVESACIHEKINIHDTKLGIESVYTIFNQRYKNICILESIKKYIICMLDQSDKVMVHGILQDIKSKLVVYNFSDKLIGKDGYNSIGYMLMEITREYLRARIEDKDLLASDDKIYSLYLASLIFKYRVKRAMSIMEYKNVPLEDVAAQIYLFDIKHDSKENAIKNYKLKLLKEYDYIRLQLHFEGMQIKNAMLEYMYDKYFIKAFDRVKYHREKSIVNSYVMNKLLNNCDHDTQSTIEFFEAIKSKYGDVKNILNAMETPVILNLGDPLYMILKYLDDIKDEIYGKFRYSIVDFYNRNIDNPCFTGATEDVDYILRTGLTKIETQPPLPVDLKFIYYSINSNKNIVSVDLDRSYLDFLITVNIFNIFTKKEEELEKRRILSEIKDGNVVKNYNKTVRELYNEGLFPPLHIAKNIKTKYDVYDFKNISKLNIDSYKKYLKIHKNYTKNLNPDWNNWITPAIHFSSPLILDINNTENLYEINDESPFSFTFAGKTIKIDGFEFNSMYQYVYFNLLKKYPPYIESPSSKKLYLMMKNGNGFLAYPALKQKVDVFVDSEIIKTKEKLYQLSLVKKFEDKEMESILVQTGTLKIVYGSSDKIFGRKNSQGENIIGDIYETIRANLGITFLKSSRSGPVGSSETETTVLKSILLDNRLLKWVSDRISRFTTTIDILKNISVEKNYKKILKSIYTFCSFKKNINITDEINDILAEAENIQTGEEPSVEYTQLLYLKKTYMEMINNPDDIKSVDYLSKLFNTILSNVVSILDSFVKNKQIKEIPVLINELNEVGQYDFFSDSLSRQIYNYIMFNYKKGCDLTDIVKNFTYIVIDELNESSEEIDFDISIDFIKKKLDSYEIPTQHSIKPNNTSEFCILKLTYFIIQNSDLESVKLIIGFLPPDLYKKYIIGNSLVQISESIIQNIENKLDPSESIEKAASILLCEDISKDQMWLSFSHSSDELFTYPDFTQDSANLQIDKIDLSYTDFYFSGQDDKPIIKKYYQNCNLTSLVEFIYLITKDNFIHLNRILCFSKTSQL